MITLLCIFLLIVPTVSFADAGNDMQTQMLDVQIKSLTQERDQKYEELKQCEQKTKGFKIAGITTLVATGIGIYGNVKLYEKLNNKSLGGGSRAMVGVDPRSTEEQWEDECRAYCDAGVEVPAEWGCQC